MMVDYDQGEIKACDAILPPVCVNKGNGWSHTRVVQYTADCADAVPIALIDEGTYAAELHLLLLWLSRQGHNSTTTKGHAHRQQVRAQHRMTSSSGTPTRPCPPGYTGSAS